MTFSIEDHQYMSRAIELAARGLYTADPNPRVGCVIVSGGTIVGEGWHVRAGEGHAEINALAHAGEKAQGATVYVSLEPCCHQGKTPPCTDALINAKVDRVVAAMQDPNPAVAGNGLQQLTNAGIFAEVGLLETAAHQLNPGFIQRMKTSRPFVRCKLAMSIDGRTAMDNGDSKWITSDEARKDVHRLRARSSAIVTGAQEGETHILTCSDDEDSIDLLKNSGAKVINLPMTHNRVDLFAMMDYLSKLEVNEVLLETGSTLSGAMLEAQLIDELIVYMAPVVMGNEARGLFRLPQLQSMEERIEFSLLESRAVGNDLRLTFLPQYQT